MERSDTLATAAALAVEARLPCLRVRVHDGIQMRPLLDSAGFSDLDVYGGVLAVTFECVEWYMKMPPSNRLD